MEIFQVRYFLAVCKSLNFTRAAEECHVSQPALSRAILQLEAELGGDLFRRERNLSHMTELCRKVFPALYQCYEASRNAKALAQAFLKEGQASLRLALSRSIDMELLSPLLGEISTAFPNVEISVYRGTPTDVAEKLKSGEAELAVAGPVVGDWERLEARKLYEEHFGLLLSRQHRLSQRNGIEPSDLFDERLLSRPTCWFADTLSAKMREAGAKSVARHEVPFLDDLSGLVRAKFGVGVWPLSRQPTHDLFVKPVRGAEMNRWIHVYTVAGRRHSVATATLISLLRSRDWPQSPPAELAIAEALH